MRLRSHWGTLAFVALIAVAVGLYLTGRLEVHWRPGATDDQGSHGHAEEAKHEEAESRVSGDKAVLDADAIKAAGIQAAPAEAGAVAVTRQLVGEVRVPDERLARVTARVPGIVREIHHGRGDRVAAGAPLVTLESPDLADARAAFAAATTDLQVSEERLQLWRRQRDGAGGPERGAGWVELDQALAEQGAAQTDKAVAERAHGRMKELQERGLRSRTELLTVEADLARATARVESSTRRLIVLGSVAETEVTRARQRVEAARAFGAELAGPSAAGGSSRFVVVSPIAGVVNDRTVTVGESVEPTSKICSIADLSEVWVTAALYDHDVAAIRTGMPAVVRVQALGEATFHGQVTQIGPQVDEKTRTLPVRVVVRNQPAPGSRDAWALRPGMFATVELEVSRRAAAVLVPAAAVQTLAGQEVVFVETALTEGASFQRRPVKLGTRVAARVEVVEGVRPGERVVVANAYLLKSEFERSKISHGHAH
jgi:cobalt-zinc-cadmium efflux system membrane fusion protein